MREPAVYIMASRRHGTLYTGVTSNLARRVYEHREGSVPGFTKRYGCKLLVWYELYPTMPEAIAREKQIKGGSRKDKFGLIPTAVDFDSSCIRPLASANARRSPCCGRL